MVTQSKAVDTVDAGGPRLLRLEDVADHLAVSRSMAWKLIAQGEIRCVRIGRAVREPVGQHDSGVDSRFAHTLLLHNLR